MMNQCIQTITNIFSTRGYTINQQEFDKIIGLKSDGEIICVFFVLNSKFNMELIQNYLIMMSELNCNHAIIVFKDSITPTAKKITENIKFKIELFHFDELQLDITHHRLVPKHEKLSIEESAFFKKQYGLKHPVLLKSDPIARYYGYERNDVIKITRKNGYVAFRIV